MDEIKTPPDALAAPVMEAPPVIPDYAERSHEILSVELEYYLRERRRVNDLAPPSEDDLSGLCISGGGVRSATLGLGTLQAFTKAGILKSFDYLSTVSGGGYIGSCLTSLLSAEPDKIDKAGTIKNENKRFDVTHVGLDEANSPFVGLNKKYEYDPLEKTELNVKQQLNHLRQHGEYLTPNKSIFGWDIDRAIGALTGGTVINIAIFLLLIGIAVTAHHALFSLMSGNAFMQVLQEPVTETRAWAQANPQDLTFRNLSSWEEAMKDTNYVKMSTMEQLSIWYEHQLSPQIGLMKIALVQKWYIAVGFVVFGVVMGIFFVIWSQYRPVPVALAEQDEQKYDGKKVGSVHERAAGTEILQAFSKPFILTFNTFCYFVGPMAAYLFTIICFQSGLLEDFSYFIMLPLPICFSIGLFGCIHISISLFAINRGEQVSGRLYRSFYSGMQGAVLLGLLTAVIFPVVLILLFGKHGAAANLTFSFVPVAVAYYFTMQTLGGRSGGGFMSAIVAKLQMPLLNLSILLFVGVALAWVSQGLYGLEQYMESQEVFNIARLTSIFIILGICLLILIFLGFRANSNDISLHYFYRDRLVEAYLRTSGRVSRPKQEQPTRIQPKGLFDVNLRNHENLMLKDLGKGNNRGPYHLVIAALNLQGSNDPARKTMKSDHFIFSKYFIGSRTTGYVNSAVYNRGNTRLSSAMAISAAAVASGMGPLSFAASNFYMTLFNLRTGYWIDNPWHFIQKEKEKALLQKGIKPRRSWSDRISAFVGMPFWLLYLWRELTGNLGAETEKVNVSDGGHTGDNLGLLPLIQRRCSTIVVCDFEEDGQFGFGSFNQVVRLAKAVYDADVKIKLRDLMPVKDEKSGALYSPASVATGEIVYTDGKIGRIVYLKSSINLLEEVTKTTDSPPPMPFFEPAPVFVLNYFKNNPAFPHQSTADQYFDEVQFEAYRMLGEHIGNQAARKVVFGKLEGRTIQGGDS